jgi:ABC-type cobalamin transport system ATPase subunit
MILGGGRAMALGAAADVLTAEALEPSLGVRIRRLDDPEGGPALFRIVGLSSGFSARGGA